MQAYGNRPSWELGRLWTVVQTQGPTFPLRNLQDSPKRELATFSLTGSCRQWPLWRAARPSAKPAPHPAPPLNLQESPKLELATVSTWGKWLFWAGGVRCSSSVPKSHSPHLQEGDRPGVGNFGSVEKGMGPFRSGELSGGSPRLGGRRRPAWLGGRRRGAGLGTGGEALRPGALWRSAGMRKSARGVRAAGLGLADEEGLPGTVHPPSVGRLVEAVWGERLRRPGPLGGRSRCQTPRLGEGRGRGRLRFQTAAFFFCLESAKK